MKKRGFLLALCLALLFSCGMPFSRGCAEESVQALLQGIYQYELQKNDADDLQSWLDGDLSRNAGGGGEWYVLSLRQSGRYDFSAYREALARYLQETTVRSASTRQKLALMMLAAGEEEMAFLAQDTLGKQGIMSWIFGLHLMNNGFVFSDVTQMQAIEKLLSLRLPDGGWALMGTVSDVDVTAMALQTLAPYRESAGVEAAAEAAFSLLSRRQAENGDFSSYGMANPESAAQVLTALAAWGIDGLEDERFIKNGNTLLDSIARFQLPDGSFSHQRQGPANLLATSQVCLGLTAYQQLLAGEGSVFVLDAMEAGPEAARRMNIQAALSLAIGGCLLLAFLLLFMLKKRHWKNFAVLALLAAAMLAFVNFTDFQSAENYYTLVTEETGEIAGNVTVTVRCDEALGKTENAYLPPDGVVLGETALEIRAGDTVYDLLLKAARENRLSVDASGPAGMKYIHGIQYLYEQDCGDLSGWVFFVNGESPSVSCDQYVLEDGDRVQWIYSCEMGRDLK